VVANGSAITFGGLLARLPNVEQNIAVSDLAAQPSDAIVRSTTSPHDKAADTAPAVTTT
jgi:hypothetical protein